MGSRGGTVEWLYISQQAGSPRQLRSLSHAEQDTPTIVDSLSELCALCMSVIDGPANLFWVPTLAQHSEGRLRARREAALTHLTLPLSQSVLLIFSSSSK